MTLKEELEILRGEPIQVFTGDPMDIPCNETSDAEKLCQNPVVSVWMITYNHEPYIRQAIEGVMMQKTDFAYELVIGEDCSTDKTREICFEYQKRYPDKIRVLWSEQNLYRNPHPAGANGRRTMAHCRGEFIAFCEGDDYWIDPLKLQKQVDIMRKYPNVGFCFCGAEIYQQDTGLMSKWDSEAKGFSPGLITSTKYMLWTMFGKSPLEGMGVEVWQMTTTFMARRKLLELAIKTFEIWSWRLSVADATTCLSCGAQGDVYYIEDVVAVYRKTSSGVTIASAGKCDLDTLIVRIYFAKQVFKIEYEELPDRFIDTLINAALRYGRSRENAYSWQRQWLYSDVVSRLLKRKLFLGERIRLKRDNNYSRLVSFYKNYIVGFRVSQHIAELYRQGDAETISNKCVKRLNILLCLKRRIMRWVSRACICESVRV